jgi:ketosteroid isomerase-like protein
VADPMGVVERWWNVWRDGDLDSLDEILADRFVRHGMQGTVVRNRAEARDEMVHFRSSMELAEVRIEARSVTGNEAWCRVTTTGVNLRLEEAQTLSWLQTCRVDDGRISEMWLLYAINVDWATP